MSSKSNITDGKITPEAALDSHKTFYAKKWQQNRYYPICKFVWNEAENGYEQFVQKYSGWYSWGVAQQASVSNRDWWINIFNNNAYILSFDEMIDNNNYNER